MNPSDSRLFSPGRIGPVKLKNRIVMPPMTTRLADAGGMVTEASIAWYAARAHGGAGLVTVEMASVEPAGKHRACELGVSDDRFIPGLTRLARAIHDGGAKASIQIGHAGGHTRRDICGEQPVAPSAVPHFVFEVTGESIVPAAMTQARIAQVVQAFAAAAQRAWAAGFDCVELHGAHGYLMSQFLCPAENVRTDEYGGTLRNRARFALEVLQAVRHAVPAAALVYRLSASDLFGGGLGLEEGVEFATWVQERGADALHVSAGHYLSKPSPDIISAPMAYPDGALLPYAEAVKAVATVPVIAVGRLGVPALAMAVVDQGRADFVSLGRTLIADPQWPNAVRAGRAVRPCLACNTCANEMRAGAKMGCVVNPAAAREISFPPRPRVARRRIAVIGAGPAGLSFAHLAAADHEVTVFEREREAGGALRWAGKAPLFQDVTAAEGTLARYAAQMTQACREQGVAFRFGFDAAKEAHALSAFDEVVVAAGARYRFGIGPLARLLLATGAARAWPLRTWFGAPAVRHWFYHQAREGTGDVWRKRLPASVRVTVIGDAARAGKSREAIASAFRHAWGPAAPPG